MLTATKDIILPTTVTGSLPRPGWFIENMAGKPFRLAMTDISFREQYLDNVSSIIRTRSVPGSISSPMAMRGSTPMSAAQGPVKSCMKCSKRACCPG
jgi:hypothetical protein